MKVVSRLIITFQDKVSVHLNGEEIRAIHVPSGHTDGDSIVYFTRSNVVHLGDDFVRYGFPFVDLASGGSVKGMIAALDRVAKELPADLRLVEAEVKKKKTLEQIQKAKVLAKHENMGKGFISADTFVEIVFKELTKQQNVFVPH